MKEESLLSLLRKKRIFFETIHELTQHEPALPLKQWVASLKKKKMLLTHIEKIDSQLSLFQDQMPHLSQDMIEELEQMQSLIHSIRTLDLQILRSKKSSFKRE